MTEPREFTNHLHGVVRLKKTSNYKVWAIKSQMILIQEGLWKAIEPNNGEPTSAKATTSTSKATDTQPIGSRAIDKTLKWQAVVTIILSLDNSLINHAIGITSAKELWRILKDLFSLQGFTARYLLHKKLVTTTLANSKSVGDFVDSLKQCEQRLQKMGSPVPNWILLFTLLHNFGDSYKSFVSSTLQNICSTKPNLNHIISQLLDKERRQANFNKTTALLTKKGNQPCSHCSCTNHFIKNCWQLYPEKAPKDRNEKQCQKDKAKQANKKNKKSNQEKDRMEKKEDDKKDKNDDVFMSASSAPSTRHADTWLIDLGATQHMCVNRASFTNYVHETSSIYLGDSTPIKVVGQGHVILQL